MIRKELRDLGVLNYNPQMARNHKMPKKTAEFGRSNPKIEVNNAD